MSESVEKLFDTFRRFLTFFDVAPFRWPLLRSADQLLSTVEIAGPLAATMLFHMGFGFIGGLLSSELCFQVMKVSLCVCVDASAASMAKFCHIVFCCLTSCLPLHKNITKINLKTISVR